MRPHSIRVVCESGWFKAVTQCQTQWHGQVGSGVTFDWLDTTETQWNRAQAEQPPSPPPAKKNTPSTVSSGGLTITTTAAAATDHTHKTNCPKKKAEEAIVSRRWLFWLFEWLCTFAIWPLQFMFTYSPSFLDCILPVLMMTSNCNWIVVHFAFPFFSLSYLFLSYTCSWLPEKKKKSFCLFLLWTSFSVKSQSCFTPHFSI